MGVCQTCGSASEVKTIKGYTTLKMCRPCWQDAELIWRLKGEEFKEIRLENDKRAEDVVNLLSKDQTIFTKEEET